jgi:hypothetical protein
VLWIGCDRLKSFGRSPKQQTIHLSFVLQSQSREWFRQSENHMEVIALQQFGLTLLKPLRAGQRLALGTMPIGARVVCVPFVAALVTLFQMTAERCGATQFDRAQHPLLLSGQRSSMRLAKLGAVRTMSATSSAGRMQSG